MASRFRRTVRVVACVLAAIGLAGPATTAFPAAAPGKLMVATLSTVLTDVARNVGGDKISVDEIIEGGVDPHEYQPTPSDVEEVTSSDMVLVSGKGLEGYLSKLQEAGDLKKFINVGSRIGASLKIQDEDKVVEDPHWWHSVANVKRAAIVVRDSLIAADPADKDAFMANTTTYLARLDELDKTLRLKMAELPRDRRKLVTSHDAFQYFAREYGFTIYPVEGVSTSEEPSARRVASLLATIRKEKVKAVFFENTQNPKVISQITRETGAKLGGELYADGLGGPTSDAPTYEAMMQHNVNAIVDALK